MGNYVDIVKNVLDALKELRMKVMRISEGNSR